MGVKYKLYYGNFGREILRSDFMKAEMETRGSRVLETAHAIAPVDSGRYLRSLRLRMKTRGGLHKDRVAAVIESRDPAALAIEFGRTAEDGTHVAGHYTLLNALDAAR